MARALMLLGSERAWVVHGADGIDEISTTGYTKISECRDGAVNTFYLHPADVGLPKAPAGALQGRRRARERANHRAASSTASAARRATSCCSTPARRCSSPAQAASVEEGIAERVARDRQRRREADARRLVAISTARRVRRRSERRDDATATASPTCSATIVAATRRIVDVREAREPLAALARRAERATPPAGRVSRRRWRARIASTSSPSASGGRRRAASCGADYDPVAIAARLRGGRRGRDFGADRADVLRRLARAPRRGSRGGRRAAAAQGLHRVGVPAARGAGGRRRRGPADRRGAFERRATIAGWARGVARARRARRSARRRRAAHGPRRRRRASSASTTGTCGRSPWTSMRPRS